MPTGQFWNTEIPEKPWGLFDPDARITFPVDVSGWVADLGANLQSFEVLSGSPLECVASSRSGLVISITMKLVSGANFTPRKKYGFTLRIICVDGQKDDRTLWLKVGDR